MNIKLNLPVSVDNPIQKLYRGECDNQNALITVIDDSNLDEATRTQIFERTKLLPCQYLLAESTIYIVYENATRWSRI